ncbi:MAG TPA: hypothetical protein VFN97_27595 [Actinospica sp.]|nr:hypothetical protein [Actinospica sp.]
MPAWRREEPARDAVRRIGIPLTAIADGRRDLEVLFVADGARPAPHYGEGGLSVDLRELDAALLRLRRPRSRS